MARHVIDEECGP